MPALWSAAESEKSASSFIPEPDVCTAVLTVLGGTLHYLQATQKRKKKFNRILPRFSDICADAGKGKAFISALTGCMRQRGDIKQKFFTTVCQFDSA